MFFISLIFFSDPLCSMIPWYFSHDLDSIFLVKISKTLMNMSQYSSIASVGLDLWISNLGSWKLFFPSLPHKTREMNSTSFLPLPSCSTSTRKVSMECKTKEKIIVVANWLFFSNHVQCIIIQNYVKIHNFIWNEIRKRNSINSIRSDKVPRTATLKYLTQTLYLLTMSSIKGS